MECADSAFFRKVLKDPSVDVGHGAIWKCPLVLETWHSQELRDVQARRSKWTDGSQATGHLGTQRTGPVW